jgi:hypothetical protein
MIDSITNDKLHVTSTASSGSYIIVPVSQLPALRNVLDSGRLRYDVDEVSISMDGKPPVIFVNFRHGIDPRTVQELLDQQP